jgi:hypothetical protein
MATSTMPATSEAIRGGIGILDFYQWKGINCIRLWPRKPKQPWTDAQRATVNQFRTAVTAPPALTPQAKALTALLPPRPYGTHRAYQIAASLAAVKTYGEFDPVYPYEIDDHPPGPGGGTLTRIQYDPTTTAHPDRTAFYFINAGDGDGALTWHQRLTTGTPGNAPNQYYVLPGPLAARRIDDITVGPTPGALDLRVSSLFIPTHILAYYTAAPDQAWLLWAMPPRPWYIEP